MILMLQRIMLLLSCRSSWFGIEFLTLLSKVIRIGILILRILRVWIIVLVRNFSILIVRCWIIVMLVRV
jgi:hypothetical protein